MVVRAQLVCEDEKADWSHRNLCGKRGGQIDRSMNRTAGEWKPSDRWLGDRSLNNERTQPAGSGEKTRAVPSTSKWWAIADLVGYQLRSQTRARKMLSSSLAPPIPKTCIQASTHPSPYPACTKTEPINRSPSTCQTTLSFSFCCLNKHASEQLQVGY